MTLSPAPLVIFILVVIAVIAAVVNEKPLKIPCVNVELKIQFWYPPLVGVLILLIEGSLHGGDLWKGGIAGDGKIQPFVIMIMFETLAYVCIAVDMTGILAFIAMTVVQKAGSSGKRLFFSFFALASAFTVCTSNDIVILTLTPIIYYCSYVTKMNPMPFLYAEFFTANICSMVLLIGNPVNIIVGTAEGVAFADYSNKMAAPAVVGALCCCVLIYVWFRKDIDITFSPPELNPQQALKDKRAALFHGIILFLTRIFLGVGPLFGAINWLITAIPAIIVLIYNCIFWKWDNPAPKEAEAASLELQEMVAMTKTKSAETSEPTADEFGNNVYVHVSTTPTKEKEIPQTPTSTNEESSGDDNGRRDWDSAEEERKANEKLRALEQGGSGKEERQMEQPGGPSPFDDISPPTAKGSLMALPWAVIPFLFGMFTLVEALNKAGWIDEFARGCVSAIPKDEGNSPRAIAIAAFFMTTVSFVLCNLVNNQPASILLTHVVISDLFDDLPDKVKSAGMYGVIEGANVGANWTIIGALAGILWSTILRNKGIVVSYFDFVKTGLMIMPVVTFMVAFIIFLEHL